jgi:hypothetical protein
MEKIYELKLHERCFLDEEISVLRVPGGWNYEYPDVVQFVPYSDEFKPKQPKQKSITMTLQERKDNFKIAVCSVQEKNRYGISDTREFFEYWTEHGEADKKMRFEKEKTFNIELRMKRWFRNKTNTQQEKQPSALRNFKK